MDLFAHYLIIYERYIYLVLRWARFISGDKVSVQLIGKDYRGRVQGKLVKILERTIKSVTGQFIRERNCCFVLPDIFISKCKKMPN